MERAGVGIKSYPSQVLEAYTCNPIIRRWRSGGSWFEVSPRQIVLETPSLK
jgi:hypothetical protein